MDDVYADIRRLLHLYCDGLHRGDIEQLRAVFHPGGVYYTASGGSEIRLDIPRYLPKVAARKAPADAGEPLEYHIDSITLAGPGTAVALVRSAMWGKRFTDILSLARADQGWKIVSKVFHHENDPGTAGGSEWN